MDWNGPGPELDNTCNTQSPPDGLAAVHHGLGTDEDELLAPDTPAGDGGPQLADADDKE